MIALLGLSLEAILSQKKDKNFQCKFDLFFHKLFFACLSCDSLALLIHLSDTRGQARYKSFDFSLCSQRVFLPRLAQGFLT